MKSGKTCPECNLDLTRHVTHHVEVDVCPSCKGVWMDRGEFDALVGRRFLGHEAEAEMASHTFVKTDSVLKCPVDHGPMVGTEFDQLELDHCPQCKGVWVSGVGRKVLAEHAAEHPFDESQVKLPRQSSLDRAVTCTGCALEVPERLTVHVQDKYYCERCFVEGNFPELEDALARLIRGGSKLRTNHERHELHGTSDHYPSAVRRALSGLRHAFD